MKVVISGGTGLVGSALKDELLRNGHEVIILTRTAKPSTDPPKLKFVQWLSNDSFPEKTLDDVDAFVNLAGASINSRWTDKYKEKILQSRLHATNEINRLVQKMDRKPNVLINASAIGFYGTSLTQEFTEQSPAANRDFLSKTVAQWESSALNAEKEGVRVALCRFGVILDKHQGALPQMAFPYKVFAGGRVGSGKQWLSWVHIHDVVRALLFIIENDKLSGPVNITAPNPVTMDQFGHDLSHILHRPHWLPVPAFVLKTFLGEMSLLVLEGQRVFPTKLTTSGFHFNYPELKGALINIFEV